MQYDAFVTTEGDSFNIEFPDCIGCQTFAEHSDDVLPMAREALEGWLETQLANRRVPPRPAHRESAPRGRKLLRVTVPPKLAAILSIRWARQDADLSQAELAARVGVSQPQIAKLEDPDGNPTLDTIQKVANALGLEIRLTFETPRAFAAVRPGRVRSSR
jgi:ribosome-binding protein aMBF1 (putative translation factor)